MGEPWGTNKTGKSVDMRRTVEKEALLKNTLINKALVHNLQQ